MINLCSGFTNHLHTNWKTITATAAITLAVSWTFRQLSSVEDLSFNGFRKRMIRSLMKLPEGQKRANEAINKELRKLEEEIFSHRNENCPTLPEKGLPQVTILALLGKMKSLSEQGADLTKVSGTIYTGDHNLLNLYQDVIRITLLANPMHSDLFGWVNQCEAEVVSMCAGMMHGGYGTMTSGGTSSIFHAIKTYHTLAKEKGIRKPNIIIPSSAHVSFNKTAELLGIEVRQIPNNLETFQVDLTQVKKQMDSNTIMIAGSAPSYPHGIMDDIASLAHLAKKNNIPLHVDCCLGGFVAPFIEDLPTFDFRLDGVTSISLDTHKHGNGEKGSSVILYRSKELRKYQFFTNTDWMGGIYMTPTLEGSRSAIPIVTAYASMLYHGTDGYKNLATKLCNLRQELVSIIQNIQGIKVIGNPKLMVFAIQSNDPEINIGQVEQEMTKKGWNLSPLQSPRSFHFCLTSKHLNDPNFTNHFISDLKESVAQAKEEPSPLTGTAAAYSAAASFPREIVDKLASGFLDLLYQTRPEMTDSQDQTV